MHDYSSWTHSRKKSASNWKSSTIPSTSHILYLSLVLDASLSFKRHVKHAIEKAQFQMMQYVWLQEWCIWKSGRGGERSACNKEHSSRTAREAEENRGATEFSIMTGKTGGVWERRLTSRLTPEIEYWVNLKLDETNYFLTLMPTEHGCRPYFHSSSHDETVKCSTACEIPEDAEHVFIRLSPF